MKLYPPPLINEQVKADMLHWTMTQPNTIVVSKDCIGKTGLLKTGDFTIDPPKPFPIDDRTKEFMLYELQRILAFNDYQTWHSKFENGLSKFEISKAGWSMEIDNIFDQLPFSDSLPVQISRAYEHWEYENLNPSPTRQSADDAFSEMVKHGMTTMTVNADHSHNYPSREHLEEVRRIVEDSIDDNDKD